MWIRIKEVGRRRITLPVPLSLMRSRLLWLIAEKRGGEDAARYYPAAQDIYRELTSYVRAHGHFTMVDVHTADGEHVKIDI